MLGWVLLLVVACGSGHDSARGVEVSATEVTEPPPEPKQLFQAPSFASAVALGDCERALELLPDAPDPAERLAAAHCELELGRPEATLTRLQGYEGLLADHATWVRARALVDAERPAEEVLQALQGLELPGALDLRVRLARAVAARDTTALASLHGTFLEAEARLEAARLAEGAERERALKQLWAMAWSPWDSEALKLLGAEPDLADPTWQPFAEQRMRALQQTMRPVEALEIFEALLALEKRKDPIGLANARFAARDYAGAVQAFAEVLGAPTEARGEPDPLYAYGLAHARQGDYETAATIYRRLMAQHPDHVLADTASFKLGYMAYDARDCDAALELLREHRTARPTSRHLDEALWFEGRCLQRKGDTVAAIATFRELMATRPGSTLVPGADYWWARLSGDPSDPKVQEGFERILLRHPTSIYAWFAAEALGRTWPANPPAEPPPIPEPLADDPRLARARELARVGLRDLARAELDTVIPSTPDEQLALAWIRIEVGDARGAAAMMAGRCTTPWLGGDPVILQACFPRPERELVDAIARRHGLPPLLPYAIMMAESALEPWATSPAGARGLMQLMPEVGERLHERTFDGDYDPDRLYSAPYNAVLGTSELGRLADSLQGSLQGDSLPAVVAAYNAGEDAVRRWIDEAGDPLPPDLFAEDCSYTETRRYVRRVLGYLMTWRYIYGD